MDLTLAMLMCFMQTSVSRLFAFLYGQKKVFCGSDEIVGTVHGNDVDAEAVQWWWYNLQESGSNQVASIADFM